MLYPICRMCLVEYTKGITDMTVDCVKPYMDPKEWDARKCSHIKEPGLDDAICNGCHNRLNCMAHPDQHIPSAITRELMQHLGGYPTNIEAIRMHLSNTLRMMIGDSVIQGYNGLHVEQKDTGEVVVHVQVKPIYSLHHIQIELGKFE